MAELNAFKDEQRERRLIRSRLTLLGFLVLLLFAGLLLRYHYLQVEQHERFSTLSDDNRVHLRSVPPVRGLIYDAEGRILAENRPSFTLSVVPERAAGLEQLLNRLTQLLNLSEAEIERYYQQLDKRRRPYEAVPLRFRLTEDELAVLAVNEYWLPGIEIEAQLIRHYPQGEYLAHVQGYVGRINQSEAAVIDRQRYAGTHIIGKTGLERQYEDVLMGQPGFEQVETDARGNVQRVLERQNARSGTDIHLFLDMELQQLLHDRLRGERASVVVIDVRTGGVLALVSVPGFDPNQFVVGISNADYRALLSNPDNPLFNRALQGQYPPGSTIKPLFGLAALQAGTIRPDFRIQDPGHFTLPGEERRFRDWRPQGHGLVDMKVAIEQSCDVYFYELGHRTGIDVLSDYGSRFGLGRRTGIDMPVESTGIMPSREWKRGSRGLAWYPGDTINTSIGQGFMLTTPMQLAQMTAVIARRGEVVVPRLVAEINGVPTPRVTEPGVEIESRHWDMVLQAMEGVIHDIRGTAYTAVGRSLRAYRMAGKSGTAQVVAIPDDRDLYTPEELAKRLRDHALFVAYAPAEAPALAVGLIVENGQSGSGVGAPIARMVFDWWQAKQVQQAQQEQRVQVTDAR